MATTTSQQSSRRGSSSQGHLIGFAAIGLIISGVVTAVLTSLFGYVDGEEFSPENFTRRAFSYYRLPIVGIQITPITRTDRTNDLESHLTKQKLVTEIPTTDDKRRWDLVVARTGLPANRRVFTQGEAQILCSYLDVEIDGKSFWLDWSEKHPEAAKILWPAIAKLARQELYVFVPPLLVVARGITDGADFQQQVDSLLAQKYIELAKTQQQLGKHATAVELYDEAITHAPQNAEAFSGRASSHTSLGQTDRASADLTEAKKFGAEKPNEGL